VLLWAFAFCPFGLKNGRSLARFLIFTKSIAARERWYWVLSKLAGKVASWLASANETTKQRNNKKLKSKGKDHEYAVIKSAGRQRQRHPRQIQPGHRPGSRRFCGWFRLGGGLQNPERSGIQCPRGSECPQSLADDVATTKAAIDSLDGEVVLVGHSYGGVVITEAGTHPKVAGLVYITAFAPDRGESVASLIANPPAGAPVPPILPPKDGYLFLDRTQFAAAFAADVDADTAAFMADSQVPWGVAALAGVVTEPAWRSKPTHYLVATADKMIPPPAQRAMAGRAQARVTEVSGSHALYVSQPAAVAEFIRQAADAAN
jgi:pimeloyl-ACP methyl ester carboxylesterase